MNTPADDLTDAEFTQLVEAAILAPSADNAHLVRFEHVGSRIRVWGLDAFVAGPEHIRVLCLISIGAAAENVRIRAQRLGRRANVLWFPDRAQSHLVAEIDAPRAGESTPHRLDDAIARRHTNRRLRFRGPPLPAADLEALADGHDSDVALSWFDGPRRPDVLRLIRLAESERFRSRALHQELFSSIRFDVGWQTSATEGLAPGSLEIERPMRPLFAALRHWRIVAALNRVGLSRFLGFRAAYLPCHLAPHVGVLTTSAAIEVGALAVGAAFERIWLRATLHGYSLQPFAGAALLALPGYAGVSPKVRDALRQGWERLVPGRTPLMLFRVGRASAASVRSSRRPVRDYVLTDRSAI